MVIRIYELPSRQSAFIARVCDSSATSLATTPSSKPRLALNLRGRLLRNVVNSKPRAANHLFSASSFSLSFSYHVISIERLHTHDQQVYYSHDGLLEVFSVSGIRGYSDIPIISRFMWTWIWMSYYVLSYSLLTARTRILYIFAHMHSRLLIIMIIRSIDHYNTHAQVTMVMTK